LVGALLLLQRPLLLLLMMRALKLVSLASGLHSQLPYPVPNDQVLPLLRVLLACLLLPLLHVLFLHPALLLPLLVVMKLLLASRSGNLLLVVLALPP
jgi:hypothetical protein